MPADIDLFKYVGHIGEKRIQVYIIFSVFVLQYLFEHFFPEQQKYNNRKNELVNIAVGIFNGLILFIPSAFIVQLIDFTAANNMGLFHYFKFTFWPGLIFTILLMDFAMYWWHRINHTWPIFWRFHRFHHEDKKMNTTTALRFHFVELIFSSIFKSLYLLLMGFSFIPYLIYEILFFVIVLIHHSNIKISWSFDMMYRQLFSSPWMHRIHHSNVQQETDTNYGSVFSFWDRLFRTYKKEAAGEIIFGVDTNKNEIT